MATRRTAILLAILLAAAFIHPAQAQVFSDGFEDGTIDAWDGNTGAAPAVVDDPTHHGSAYALECDGNTEGAYKTLSSNSEYYARLYFQFAAGPSSGTGAYVYQLGYGSTVSARVLLYNNAGTLEFQVYYRLSGGTYTTETVSGVEPAADMWYCLELWFKQNANGGCTLHIDGVLEWTATGKTINLALTDVRIYVANMGGAHYYDCVIVDTSYIGPEAEAGQDLTFTEIGNLLLHDSAIAGLDLARTYGDVLALYASDTMNKEAGFQLSGTLALWAATTLGYEWGFLFGGVLHLWSSMTSTFEIAGAGLNEVFTLLATLRLHAAALPTLEVRTPVEHAFNLYAAIHLHDSHAIAKELGYLATGTIRLWDSAAMTTQGVAQELTFILSETLHLIASVAATMETAALVLDAASIAGLALIIALVAVALIMARRRND